MEKRCSTRIARTTNCTTETMLTLASAATVPTVCLVPDTCSMDTVSLKNTRIANPIVCFFLITMSLVACLLAFVPQAEAGAVREYSYCGINYKFENGVMSVTGAYDSSALSDAYIFEAIGSYPVTKIDDYAFAECSKLRRVTIPEGVETVGAHAFDGCGRLTSADLPTTLTGIGAAAFRGCASLTAVDIPDAVSSIPDSCFAGCTSLADVSMPTRVKAIGSLAFDGCSCLKTVSCRAATCIFADGEDADEYDDSNDDCDDDIDESDEEAGAISTRAFRNCSALRTIDVPSVHEVASMAFYNCKSLQRVVIPDAVVEIHKNAFNGSNKTMLVVCHRGTAAAVFANYGGYSSRFIESLANATVTNVYARVWTGKNLMQSPVVRIGNTKLVAGRDYTVAYTANKNVGKATVRLVGIAPYYDGSTIKAFNINPKNTALKRLKTGKKKFTVSWTNVASQADGYQIRYSLKKNMAGAKTKTIYGAGKTSLTAKSLKAKKKYFVQVRVFKAVDDDEAEDEVRYYSGWSNAKAVKTK